ncbi:MAG: TetR family transcriptional regulator [Ruminococcaceae bacterium]|nr:TetR family transcriptional regulator [Oscillospiraceae bacterium]
MEEKKTDRRTLKTRKAIYDALMDLLTKKELHKVTVQEISDIADINRATFYKHFLDVYDLYDKLEQEILIEWGMLVLNMQDLKSKDFFINLVNYVDKNKNVFKMVFNSNAPGQLRARFQKLLEGLLQKIESEKRGADFKDVKLSYQTCYRSQGCIAILTRWIEEGAEQPKELIVKVLSELDSSIAKIV